MVNIIDCIEKSAANVALSDNGIKQEAKIGKQ